jgi:spectinomycin phosphotransferase/16S rRNA (guanine(1405)-N(7))-methyltransferase
MLSPPDGLSAADLVPVLARGWGVTAVGVRYRPVGFGSHHWLVTDAAGGRWFATADELSAKQRSRDEPLDAAFGRLRDALATACDLRERGLDFVVAPARATDGEPLVRAGEKFGVALYPFVDGQSFAWGDFGTAEHRRAVLDMIVALHAAPAPQAQADDFAVLHRDELEAAIRPAADVPDCGPYARPAALLLAQCAPALERLLARYDELAERGRGRASAAVLTHGEPHPGNTMRAAGRWLLIDWDTTLMAPPERDLWSLDPGDGSVLRAYADATGVPVLPSMLELYRLRWDLADIAVEVSRFRAPHRGSPDDFMSWAVLRSTLDRVAPVSPAG